MFYGSGGVEVGGLQDTPVVLIAAFWPVVMVRLREGIQGGH